MIHATPEAPIVVAFPTIQSGMVLRWYRLIDDDGEPQDELLNAGREGVTVLPSSEVPLIEGGVPAEWIDTANGVHAYLVTAYRIAMHPRIDVSPWVTHKMVSFPGRAVEPV